MVEGVSVMCPEAATNGKHPPRHLITPSARTLLEDVL